MSIAHLTGLESGQIKTLLNGVIDDINDEIAAIEALPGVATVTNLATLDAISTATIGDIVLMTSPGTGIDALYWSAYAGSGSGIDWRPLGPVIASTKANLDSFVSAVAAIADTRFWVGKNAFVTGINRTYQFTSTTGAYRVRDAVSVVIPTSVDSGSVATGGKVTSAAVALVRLRNCFDDDFDQYEIDFDITLSGATSLETVLAVAASDTITGYDVSRVIIAATTITAAQLLNQTSMLITTTGIAGRHTGTLVIRNPRQAQETGWAADALTTTNPMTATAGRTSNSGIQRATTAFDSLAFKVSTGTLTVNAITVRGRNKG